VHQSNVEDPRSGDPPKTSEPWTTLNCKHCGSTYISRIYREGLMQERIYPLFGLYPWRCKICREKQMLRRRNKSEEKSKSSTNQRLT